MGEVVRLPGGRTTLQEAANAFLDHHDLARSTRRVYRASLASLVAELDPATAVGELSGSMLAGWFRGRYAAVAPATWNRELATLRAAVSWWCRRGWLAVDPTDALERRRERVDRTRALTRGQLERLFARRDLPLRERTLWRLLYETAARANELLALDVEDLDLANRRARVHSKGGAIEWGSGRPGRPSCSPACWPAGPADRYSWVTAGQPAPPPASTWIQPAGGPGCRTDGPPSSFACTPGGPCISCATRPLPMPPRTAPTCRCCWPGPATPRSAPWSATPAPDPMRSPATWPRLTRLADDPDQLTARWAGQAGSGRCLSPVP